MRHFVEKRRFERIAVEGTAEVGWCGKSFWGRVRNVSLLGAMVEIPVEIPVGDPVSLRMHIEAASQNVVLVEGVVARTGAGTGVKFTNIDILSLAHLRNLFAHNSILTEKMIDEYQKMIARDTAAVEAEGQGGRR